MAATGSQNDPSGVGMMENLQIGDGTDHAIKSAEAPPTLQLTDQERKILELYDRLEEIRLETSILTAEETSIPDQSESISQKELKAAQEALLEARSVYNLRNSIVESVLMANPILKAVHATSQATAIERDLLPMIRERDTLMAALSSTTEKIVSVTGKLTQAQADHINVSLKNTQLAEAMVALAKQVDAQKKQDINDPAKLQEITELEEALRNSRQRWRIMKGTASAVVAGSGIDWARDDQLRDLVMDNDSD